MDGIYTFSVSIYIYSSYYIYIYIYTFLSHTYVRIYIYISLHCICNSRDIVLCMFPLLLSLFILPRSSPSPLSKGQRLSFLMAKVTEEIGHDGTKPLGSKGKLDKQRRSVVS